MEFEDEIVKELLEPLKTIELEVGIGEDILVTGELGKEILCDCPDCEDCEIPV
jgi:hypothetical protein